MAGDCAFITVDCSCCASMMMLGIKLLVGGSAIHESVVVWVAGVDCIMLFGIIDAYLIRMWMSESLLIWATARPLLICPTLILSASDWVTVSLLPAQLCTRGFPSISAV